MARLCQPSKFEKMAKPPPPPIKAPAKVNKSTKPTRATKVQKPGSNGHLFLPKYFLAKSHHSWSLRDFLEFRHGPSPKTLETESGRWIKALEAIGKCERQCCLGARSERATLLRKSFTAVSSFFHGFTQYTLCIVLGHMECPRTLSSTGSRRDCHGQLGYTIQESGRYWILRGRYVHTAAHSALPYTAGPCVGHA
jgi:hypothetical protein